MEKIVFKRNDQPQKNYPTIRISEENHRVIQEISQEANIPISGVANRLLEFAIKHVDWED